MKIKSNRFKCRNLPKNYDVKAVVKSKPIFMMCLALALGIVLIFMKSYMFVGILLLGMALFGLIFSKNPVTVEFSDQFVVFYLDDHQEDCYLVYYEDIDRYEYKRKVFDTDVLQIVLKNQKVLEFKSLDKKKVTKNLNQHVKSHVIDDEE